MNCGVSDCSFEVRSRDHRILSRKKVHTAGRVGPKETDYSA